MTRLSDALERAQAHQAGTPVARRHDSPEPTLRDVPADWHFDEADLAPLLRNYRSRRSRLRTRQPPLDVPRRVTADCRPRNCPRRSRPPRMRR